MKDIKNYIIALLAGLLVLTISTQPSQGAGTSKEAKIVQYTFCLQMSKDGFKGSTLSGMILKCREYQP